MEIRTVIFVDAWGGVYDCYTKATLVHSELFHPDTLKDAFCAKKGINSFKGHSYAVLDELTDEFIKFLKKQGFKELKGETIYFSD